ncbi:polymeric immunoglobulin receptor [Oncorhynchus mykiss]|uniref:polymeric immunoglobulin receptor-like n=1 Tax=Oncorhynchus mykiss TaxID=8022 RepID=UPI0018775C30|nr:polymeric immunoglobulin receptor-like [Oncorhynchus mykiss]XP_036804870.1 polymeric immunoglobulin receptor [Oncorhynchus mykiss]
MRILLIVILLSFMTGCLSSFTVTGYSGGTVIIYCHYSTEERSNEKYLCVRQYSLSYEDQIRTVLNNTWKHSGRFSLYDNTRGNYFKVMIRQLTRQDEGTYWCGVDQPIIPDSYTKVELDVKKDDCCEKSVTETAFLGGEATIRCNYPEDHEDNIKYFCKEDSESDCEYQISGTYNEQLGRYSLSKRRRERFSTVTISDLTEDDTGTYWCGVETSRTEQRYITLITQVKLDVINWRDVKPINVTEQVGETAKLTCKYPADHKKNEKFFCKGDSPLTCEDKVTATKPNIIIRNKRFSLRDNSEKTNFTVHIKMMRPEDSGTYWCGSDRRWRPADSTRFILSVVAPTTTIMKTKTTAPPTTTFLSLSSPPSPSSSSPSSSLSPASSLNGSGTSVFIMVSVSLVVLLLVISLIIVYRWKYNKVTGFVSSTHRVSPDTGNKEGGCHGDGDYEEIMERAPRSDSGAATSTIYTTVNLPTSHSDSPHYASVNFHKNPSSSNEATDTITKEGRCPNEATASIAKEGTSSCDYATVNFGQSPASLLYCHPHSSSEAPPIYSTISKPRDT